MSYDGVPICKDNLDLYLSELAKIFKKLYGKEASAEIILIGGASVLVNYDFRQMSYDIDAIILADAEMKDAINRIGDQYSLPTGWLNEDFKKTNSYSPKLREHARYYRTFSDSVVVRTISGEHLVAMKLMSGRKYKSDLSDVIGILMAHAQKDVPIMLEAVRKAATDLYGAWERLPTSSVSFIEQAMAEQNYSEVYRRIRDEEIQRKDVLIEFEREHPGEASEQTIDDILSAAQQKMEEAGGGPQMGM